MDRTPAQESFRKSLQKHLDYPDIGRVVYGKWGAGIVKMFLVLTQFGFCVSYHIFLGNTIYDMMYPSFNEHAETNTSHVEIIPEVDVEQLTNFQQQSTLNLTMTTLDYFGNFTTAPFDEILTPKPTSFSSSWTPPLALLVIFPLPLFSFVCFNTKS